MKKTNREILREKSEKMNKLVLRSMGVILLGASIVGVGGIRASRVQKPAIYQTYEDTQDKFYKVKWINRDLENISDESLESTKQNLNQLESSLKKNLESIGETPELKEYNNQISKYTNFPTKFGGALTFLGLGGMIYGVLKGTKYMELLSKSNNS